MTRYDLLSVKTALETLYAQGYTMILFSDFLTLFCAKYGVDEVGEHRRVRAMCDVLARNQKIRMRNDRIYMSNMLSCNLRLQIVG